MAKEAIKSVGLAATEGALKSLMPGLQETLTSIRDEMRSHRDRFDTLEAKLSAKMESLESKLTARMDSVEEKLIAKIDLVEDKIEMKIDALRQEMFDRFEATRDTINELAQRISRVDGALEAYARIVGPRISLPAQSALPPRKRRAG